MNNVNGSANYYEELMQKIKNSGLGYDLDRIQAAYEYARAAHEGQYRDSGEPYISHPMMVAAILVDMGMDSDSLVAALLHDCIEDTGVSYAEVKKEFGAQVADLVDGVTKLGKIPYSSKEEEQVENLRKMFFAMAKDIRVIIIKLADRLHNMRTLDVRPENKRRETSLETMEVYAPIAHRLGMQRVKVELEDIALRHLDPVGFTEVVERVREKKAQRDDFLKAIMQRVGDRLRERGVDARISGRVKHYYSVYRKMFVQNRNIDEIYDLYAVRVIVGGIEDCYNVLGVVHDAFKPIPGRFKDYISTPKPNLYQSLHTTVIGKEGIPFEVQIRTDEMHRTAEYGIAAHWKYKQGLQSGKQDTLDGKLEWVRQMLEYQTNTNDTEDFMRTLKLDLLSEEVYVFTPKGDLVNLPTGANVIDFAYAIHSAVGNRMLGAKVNGKMVPLEYQVSNGEIIEVVTSSATKGPSRDWLKIAKTSEAKNKIKQWFKKEKREENIVNGREELERELKRVGIPANDPQTEEILLSVARRVGITGVEEMYATIGYGGLSISRILPRIREDWQKILKQREPPEPEELPADFVSKKKRRPGGVEVKGVDNCLVKFAGCCNPLPGDEITGFVTKGFGVSIHRKDCVNVTSALSRPEESGRFVEVAFTGEDRLYLAAVLIYSSSRFGILAEVTANLSNMRVPVQSLSVRRLDDGSELMQLTVEVRDTEHLRSVMAKLLRIKGVTAVRRSTSL